MCKEKIKKKYLASIKKKEVFTSQQVEESVMMRRQKGGIKHTDTEIYSLAKR